MTTVLKATSSRPVRDSGQHAQPNPWSGRHWAAALQKPAVGPPLTSAAVEASGTRPIGLPPGASTSATGEDEAKYGNGNPVVCALIDRLMRTICQAAGSTLGSWVDVGIGEGLALEAMQARAGTLVGIEYRHDKLSTALQRLPDVRGVRADAGMLPIGDQRADIVTCLEVLEHLVTPEPAVAELARISRGRCVVSVPWEPYFRLGNLCRGKDIRRLGNNVEHVNQFRPSTLEQLLRREFADVSILRCFPWIVAVAAGRCDR